MSVVLSCQKNRTTKMKLFSVMILLACSFANAETSRFLLIDNSGVIHRYYPPVGNTIWVDNVDHGVITRSLVEYDCGHGKSRILSSTHYDAFYDVAQQIVSGESPWVYVAPNTVDKAVWKIVCKN